MTSSTGSPMTTVVRTRTAVIFRLSTLFGVVVAYETKRDDGDVLIKDAITSVGLNYQLK